jgi:hypothetical protein
MFWAQTTGTDKMPRCSEMLENSGEPGGTRTRDHRIKSAMLYQLSYRPDDLSSPAYRG